MSAADRYTDLMTANMTRTGPQLVEFRQENARQQAEQDARMAALREKFNNIYKKQKNRGKRKKMIFCV